VLYHRSDQREQEVSQRVTRHAYQESMRKLHRDRRGIASILAAMSLLGVGCGSSGPSSSSSASASGGGNGKVVKDTISNYTFAPATLTVTARTTIAWTNKDSTPHTATASSSSFDTGAIDSGQTKEVTLTKPGTYTFVCSFHPFMHGTIIVK
jgi:plastocyanin